MKEDNCLSERPIFIPPRKRGAKTSPRSNSSHQLAAVTPIHLKQSPKEINHSVVRSLSVSPEKTSSQRKSPNFSVAKLRKNCSFAPTEILVEEPNSISTDCRHADVGLVEIDLTTERSALNTLSAKNHANERYLTMTGTIKRGKKKGQTMDMKVNISREELDEIEDSIRAQKLVDEEDDCFFGLRKGPHVFVMSLFLFPFIFFFCAGYSFYMGTMTWYNVLVLYTERKTVVHKVFASPFLIILYPFLIILCTLGLGVYAAVIQLSWHYDKWKREVVDWEKGFYGWLCGILRLEDCSPYEVVILTEIQPEAQCQLQLRKETVQDSTV